MIFGGDLDYPYRVLELGRDFTYQQLKFQYKKMVFRYHPDKTANIMATNEFKILTTCYKYLLERLQQSTLTSSGGIHASHTPHSDEYQYRPAHCHTTLKQMHEEGKGSGNQGIEGSKKIQAGKDFNVQKFNREYDSHHYIDPLASRGYEAFMKGDTPDHDAMINKGHNGYDEIAEGPQPLDGIDLSECYELGGEFKNLGRTSVLSKGLHYMDLQLAHTTSQIVDPLKITQKPVYKTLDALRAERERPIELSHTERLELQREDDNTRLQEDRRKQLQWERDKEIAEYHSRAQNILMR